MSDSEGELHSTWAPMIDSISSTMFFSCDNFIEISEITLKSSKIMVRDWKSQVSAEEMSIWYSHQFAMFTLICR